MAKDALSFSTLIVHTPLRDASQSNVSQVALAHLYANGKWATANGAT